MNNENQPTAIVSFGAAAATDFVLVEIDHESHADSEGNVPSTFEPGEDVFVLVHHGADVVELRAVDTASGTIELLGTVTRENTVELTFAPEVKMMELPHIPTGLVDYLGFGVVGNVEANGSRQVVSSVDPAIVRVTYNYEASRYRYRLPEGFVPGNEDFPVNFYVETKEAK